MHGKPGVLSCGDNVAARSACMREENSRFVIHAQNKTEIKWRKEQSSMRVTSQTLFEGRF
jgi:hypothetical protein